jgi:hypothetical protein
VAQKPITTSEDVVTYLTTQHEAIKALFIETLDAKDTDTQQEAFTRLRTLLAVHETAEEMMVHPRVRRKVDGGAEITTPACPRSTMPRSHWLNSRRFLAGRLTSARS